MTADPAARLRSELVGAQAHLTGLDDDHARLLASAVGANSDDEHDVEGASLAWERQQLEAVRGHAAARVAALHAALARADRGDYGRCATCGHPIGAERLAARPDAERCVGCAARR